LSCRSPAQRWGTHSGCRSGDETAGGTTVTGHTPSGGQASDQASKRAPDRRRSLRPDISLERHRHSGSFANRVTNEEHGATLATPPDGAPAHSQFTNVPRGRCLGTTGRAPVASRSAACGSEPQSDCMHRSVDRRLACASVQQCHEARWIRPRGHDAWVGSATKLSLVGDGSWHAWCEPGLCDQAAEV
jgi:hypothetical protein